MLFPPVEWKIQQIQLDPPGSDTGSNTSLNKEYVVIVNTGPGRVTLTGWMLWDRDGHAYRFPVFAIRGGARVTIHTRRGSNNAANLFWDFDGYV